MRQALFLAIFGLLCGIFVFWVPRGRQEESDFSAFSGATEQRGENSDSSLGQNGQIQTGNSVLRIGVEEAVRGSGIARFLERQEELLAMPIVIETVSGAVGTGADYDLLLMRFAPEMPLQSITFSQNLSPLFVSGEVRFAQGARFIPYGMDPLVSVMLSGQSRNGDWEQRFLEWEKPSAYSSFLLWPQSSSALWSQNVAFALMRRDFIQFNDVGAFLAWLEMLSPPALRQKITQMLTADPDCQSQLLTCFLSKRMIEVGFAFYHEVAKQAGLTIEPYPYDYLPNPARVYGFGIPMGSQQLQGAQQVILSALQLSDEQWAQMLDEDWLISLLHGVKERQCFQRFCAGWQEVSAIQDEEVNVASLFQDTLLIKVQEKKLKPDLYLQSVFI